MKKLLAFLLCFVMCLSLAGCGNNSKKYLDHRHSDLYPGDVCDKCNSICNKNWKLLDGIGNYVIMYTGEDFLIEFYDNISLNYIHINEDFDPRWVKYVYIAPEVTEIPSEAFEYSSLQYVVFSESLEIIGDGAFRGCKQLKEITLPESLIKIGSSAFAYTPIKSIKLGSNLLEIGSRAFAETNISSISVPDSVEAIGKEAFADSKLKKIYIGKGVKHIGAKAFSGCHKKLKVTFEETENWFVKNEYHAAINIDKSAILRKKDAGQLFLSKYCAYDWYRNI